LLSVETALSFGVDLVEIDIHVSRDGHLIVMHDDRVERTTNGSGYIRDLTLNQIQALETGSHQRVPTLDEVITAVRGRAGLMIDIKARLIVGQIVEAAARAREIPVCYASFFHAELLEVRRLQPAADTIALIDAVPVSSAAFAIEASATYAGISFDSLVPDFVRSLKNEGIGVFTYTVDDRADIDYARSLSVDGIISNFPDRLR
jgi:glycerophosphoryl diester phosphodiesterase